MYIAECGGMTEYFRRQLRDRGVVFPLGFDIAVSTEDDLYLFYKGEGSEQIRVCEDAKFDTGTHLCGTIDVEKHDLDHIASWVQKTIHAIMEKLYRLNPQLVVV